MYIIKNIDNIKKSTFSIGFYLKCIFFIYFISFYGIILINKLILFIFALCNILLTNSFANQKNYYLYLKMEVYLCIQCYLQMTNSQY